MAIEQGFSWTYDEHGELVSAGASPIRTDDDKCDGCIHTDKPCTGELCKCGRCEWECICDTEEG